MNEQRTNETNPAAPEPAVGTAQVRNFQKLLHRYKAGKTNLERRIIDNEQWWKLRHNDGSTPGTRCRRGCATSL